MAFLNACNWKHLVQVVVYTRIARLEISDKYVLLIFLQMQFFGKKTAASGAWKTILNLLMLKYPLALAYFVYMRNYFS